MHLLTNLNRLLRRPVALSALWGLGLCIALSCNSCHASTPSNAETTSYTMLSRSLFPYNRITSTSHWWQFDFRCDLGSIPREEVPASGKVWHTSYEPKIPFRFPANPYHGNALLANGVRIPIPKAHCKAIWILTACVDGSYTGNAVIMHEDRTTESQKISIPNEVSGTAGQGVAIEFSHTNSDLVQLADHFRVFIVKIPASPKSPVTELTIERCATATPIIYAITTEHFGHASPTVTFRGKVIASDGVPVRDAEILIGPYYSRTDSSGGFSLEEVVPSSYKLGCRKLGCLTYLQEKMQITDKGSERNVATIVLQSRLLPPLHAVVNTLKLLLGLCAFAMFAGLFVRQGFSNRPTKGHYLAILEFPSTPIRRLLRVDSDPSAGFVAEAFGVFLCIALIRLLS